MNGDIVKQSINAKSVENSTISQAGRDINNGNVYNNFNLTINENVSSDVINGIEDIKKILLSNMNENIPILNKLLSDQLDKIKNYINEGMLTEAWSCIENLVNEDIKKVPNEIIVNLYYYKGLILLEKNDTDGVMSCIKNIYKTNVESEKLYELQFRLSIEIDDSELFDKSLQGLEQIGGNRINIELKKILYELRKGNYEEAIDLLVEDNVLKKCYKDNDTALYYLGTALINLKQYDRAIKYLEKAYSLKSLKYYKYNLILAEILPLLEKEGITLFITKEEKELLKNKLDELLALSDYFRQSNKESKSQYWGIIFNILLILKPGDVIEKYNSIDEDIKESPIIQLMLAEAYELIEKYNEALGIFEDLYKHNSNPEILIKILCTLKVKNEHESIINIVEKLDCSQYDKRGMIVSLYLDSLYMTQSFTIVHNKINDLKDKFPKTPMFHLASASAYLKHEDIDKCIEFLDKATDLVVRDDDIIRIDIAKMYFEIGNKEKGVQVLIPFEKYSRYVQKYLLEKIMSFNEQEYTDLAEEIVDRELSKNVKEKYLFNNKADILMRNKKMEKALNIFEESFELSNDQHSAYYIVAIKINKKDSSNIDKYIKYLSSNSEDLPNIIMLLASAESFLGNRGHGEELAFKAIYKLYDEFNEQVFINYIRLHFEGIEREKDPEVEYVKVRENSVVELIDNENNRRLICINNEEKLVGKDGERAIGCYNYHTTSFTGLKLLNKHVNSEIVIDNTNYKIKSIINKYVYAFRYCMNLYVTNCPGSKALMPIRGSSIEDMIENMKPILIEGKERQDFLIRQYNFENGMGLPSSVLCNNEYTRYTDVIISLLNWENQIYYAGDIVDIDSEPIILSLSTIIILKLYKKIDIIKTLKDRIYIPSSLLEKIKSIMMSIYSTERNTKGRLGINDNEKLVFTEFTDDAKKQSFEFWREILEIIQEINVENDIDKYESELTDAVSELVEDFELDSIFLSYKLNGIYISDDLFLRKLAKLLFTDIKTSNFVSLFERDIDGNFLEFLDIIYQLSEKKYLYIVNENTLYKIISEFINNDNIEIDYWIKYSKMYQIINNMFSDISLFKAYGPMLYNVYLKIRQENPEIKMLHFFMIILQIIKDKKVELGIE